MKKPDRIIISRTDSIGDVVLTLPLAGAIKQWNPECTIIFLGRNYTKDVVELSKHVDEFASWDNTSTLNEKQKTTWLKDLHADIIIHVFPRHEIAKSAFRAKIPVRLGSTGRLYHYRYCNKLVPLSRKNSDLHESQLNFKLLTPLTGKKDIPSLDEIAGLYGIHDQDKPKTNFKNLLDKHKFNLILHPKSKGSAREWPPDHFSELIDLLPREKFKLFITGTAEEGKLLKSFLEKHKDSIIDLTGKFSLHELISFIHQADGLVAASTGPLHLAAAMDKLVVGIYPPIRPMHPSRWAPVGKNAHYLVVNRKCDDCRKTGPCHCMAEIEPEQVKEILMKYA